jgi:hypothetical protein
VSALHRDLIGSCQASRVTHREGRNCEEEAPGEEAATTVRRNCKGEAMPEEE